jgi:hypothetical protein
MSSFGHDIRFATEEERQPGSWMARCSRPRCAEPIVYLTTYCYITGRGGSITNARHFTCEAHGLQFAAKYNLTQ